MWSKKNKGQKKYENENSMKNQENLSNQDNGDDCSNSFSELDNNIKSIIDTIGTEKLDAQSNTTNDNNNQNNNIPIDNKMINENMSVTVENAMMQEKLSMGNNMLQEGNSNGNAMQEGNLNGNAMQEGNLNGNAMMQEGNSNGNAMMQEGNLNENIMSQENISLNNTDNNDCVKENMDVVGENDIKDANSIFYKEAYSKIMENLSNLDSKVEEMNSLFLQKIAHTKHEEQIVDVMHAELQKYKQDMYSQLVRPILLDIIEIRDSILRMSANYASKPEAEQNIPLKTFSDYAYDVQDILEKNNINIFNSSEGEEFNPSRQKVIKKVETSNKELHGKIAESLSSGYEYLGKPISAEKVAVYIYK